jgi:hypothetical protein
MHFALRGIIPDTGTWYGTGTVQWVQAETKSKKWNLLLLNFNLAVLYRPSTIFISIYYAAVWHAVRVLLLLKIEDGVLRWGWGSL